MAAPLRIQRLEQRIVAKVGEVLQRNLSDPRLGLVTITRARLTKSLETCDVFWSTLDEGKKRALTEQALISARGYVQREVAGELQLRSAPRLTFVFDKGFEAASRVQELITKAANEARRKAEPPEDQPT